MHGRGVARRAPVRALSLVFSPAPPDRLWGPIRRAAFVLFVLVTCLLLVVHEPWRDEAQSWLLARDADPWTLLSYLAGHEATPVLWHFINMPFAQADFPFVTQRLINAACVTAAAWLVLWRAPFPPWLRLGVVFSGYLIFEYNAVARSYGLGAMLLFLALALDPVRSRRPVLYGTILGLLANSHVFGLFLASGLGLAWLGDLRRADRGAILTGMAVATAAGLLAIWQILPPDDNLRSGAGVGPPQTADWPRALYAAGLGLAADFWKVQPFGPRSLPALAGVAGLWLVLLWRLRRAPRGAVLFLVMAAGLIYLAAFERRIDYRHASHLMLAFTGALWLGGAAIWRGRSAMEVLNRTVLAGVLALSSMSGLYDVCRDVGNAYAPGRGMARYIREAGLADRTIVADRAPPGSAVLPYLPETRLYYPALHGFGTYIVWRGGLSNEATGQDLRAEIAARGFSRPLILTERRLDDPRLRLLHVERSIGGSLFLYALLPAP